MTAQHGHEHRHHHHHAVDSEYLGKAFKWGIILNLVYVAVEFGYGLHTDSMALISDAGHNLSDVVTLVLSMFAFRMAQRKPNAGYTYGYKKSTILVSLLNACLLLGAVGVIVAESVRKISNPTEIEGGTIALVAGMGIVVNAATALLFFRQRKHDLNVKGAFLHMAADALVSVGVVVSGIVISHTGWNIIDPIIGLVVAVIILISTADLLLDSLRLSLDGVPTGIDTDEVAHEIVAGVAGVKDVHHIHIWALSTTENAFTAHVVIDDINRAAEVKEQIRKHLKERGISHATIETELPQENCHDHCCEDDD